MTAALGLLGRAPIRLNARNKTEGNTLVVDFDLAAATLAATGSARYGKDLLGLTGLACDATLTREALASLPLSEGVELEPGTKVALRVPSFALARTSDGWKPSGDLAAKATVTALRVKRAPGLVGSLAIARVEADAAYAFRDERATVKGAAQFGETGGDGALTFDLAWRKPVEAKLFAGAEGSLALARFDLSRFEQAFGLPPGGYSGVLGGAGNLAIVFHEREVAHAEIKAEFPKARADFAMDVLESVGTVQPAADAGPTGAARRVVEANGKASAEIGAEAVAKLAGLGADPKRRITGPVQASFDVSALAIPLNAAMKPQVAALRLEATGSLSPISVEVTDATGARSSISTGPLALVVRSARLADEIVVRLSSGVAAAGAIEVDAKIRGAVAVAPQTTANPVLDATVKATKYPAAALDALASTKGAIGKYIGDSIDADIVANGLAADRGALKVRITSQLASLDAPELSISGGFARVSAGKPVKATISLSPTVRQELLAAINPVFADVSTGAPARFTLTNLAWPLDGDKRKFDGSFLLETGEVKLTNSGPLSFLLTALGAGRADGFEAYLEPLRGTITKGRLTYKDFALRAGKTAQQTWKNSLLFAGDIDLATVPMRAYSISTGVPLSDAANWSSDAKRVFDGLGAVSPELLKSLVVGVDLSGPLFDAAGRPAKLEMKLKLPDIGDVVRDNPGAIIDAAGSIFDAIRNRGKKKDTPPAKP